MRAFRCIRVLVLVCVVSGLGIASASEISFTKDRFTGSNTLSVERVSILSDGWASVTENTTWVQLEINAVWHDGETEGLFMVFWITPEHASLRHNAPLDLLVDSERMPVGVPHGYGRAGTAEIVGFKVSRAQLRQLAEAKVVEGRISGTEFVIPQSVLTNIGGLLERLKTEGP
jgi:hypothetical protein